jgi:hypothetical protein
VFKHGDRLLDASYLTSSWAVYNLVDLSDSERTLVNDWVKAAFDSNSFGIDDNILRYAKLSSAGCMHRVDHSYPDRQTHEISSNYAPRYS